MACGSRVGTAPGSACEIPAVFASCLPALGAVFTFQVDRRTVVVANTQARLNGISDSVSRILCPTSFARKLATTLRGMLHFEGCADGSDKDHVFQNLDRWVNRACRVPLVAFWLLCRSKRGLFPGDKASLAWNSKHEANPTSTESPVCAQHRPHSKLADSIPTMYPERKAVVTLEASHLPDTPPRKALPQAPAGVPKTTTRLERQSVTARFQKCLYWPLFAYLGLQLDGARRRRFYPCCRLPFESWSEDCTTLCLAKCLPRSQDQLVRTLMARARCALPAS